MSALDKKLYRDLIHMWGQALAIALVLAAGAATLILAVGAYRSLDETRRAYYERYRFAHIFAAAKRVPNHLKEEIARIDGVAFVETRIAHGAILAIDDYPLPATGQIISLPATGPPVLNGLYIRQGRLPEPDRPTEIAVNESFAKAHGLTLGSTLDAILNGKKRSLTITATVLSPEFIYTIGPGELIPDNKSFGIIYMTRDAAEAAFDLESAFNSVSLTLQRGAQPQHVIDRVDTILKRYGGRGAYTRKDQVSHAFIDAELKQLRTMSMFIPPIFLAVAAFLINMTLARLLAMEREQIGLLKALGYHRFSIAAHYLKLIAVIALIGTIIGFVAGTWLGRGMTVMYAEFFHFPFLVFHRSIDSYVVAGGICVGAAILGGLKSVMDVMALSPAVAMSPPLPTKYGRAWSQMRDFLKFLPQAHMMVLRHLLRFPMRALLTTLGMGASCGLLVMSFSFVDSIDHLIDFTYFQSSRQDASIGFSEVENMRVIEDVKRLPGVMVVEPVRMVGATMRSGHYEKRLGLTGVAEGTDLQKVLDQDSRPILIPKTGAVVTDALAKELRVGVGDKITVEVQEGKQRTIEVPIVSLIQSYLGLNVYMDLDRMNALLGDGQVISGVNLGLDEKTEGAFFARLKEIPSASGITLQRTALKSFRQTLAQNIIIMMTVYVTLAVVITFGVVYNSSRIQLSERGRELASLRVLGFTRAEVSWILLGEIALIVVVSIPLGWVMGYSFTWFLYQGFESDLYRIPLVISRATYIYAGLTVIAAAIISALIVRHRIDGLDLVAVLKTRE